MFQRFIIVGVIGVIGLASGCSSWPSTTVQKAPTTTAEERPLATTELTSAEKTDTTKQVTIAVSGMT